MFLLTNDIKLQITAIYNINDHYLLFQNFKFYENDSSRQVIFIHRKNTERFRIPI